MSYKCPRCGGPLEDGYSERANKRAGPAGDLFYAATALKECKKCGKISRNEFTEEVRNKMDRESLLKILGAIAIIIGILIIVWGSFWVLATM